LYVDDSSNNKQCGVGVILESPTGIKVEQSLHFNFKASNNQVEYETLIAKFRRRYGSQAIKMPDRLTVNGRPNKWSFPSKGPVVNKILPKGVDPSLQISKRRCQAHT